MEHTTGFNVQCILTTTTAPRKSPVSIIFGFQSFILQTHFAMRCHIHCIQRYSGCVCVCGGGARRGIYFHTPLKSQQWPQRNSRKCQSYKTLDCFPSHPGLYNGQTYILGPGTQPLNKGPTPRLTRHTGFTFLGPGILHAAFPCFSPWSVAKGTPADS